LQVSKLEESLGMEIYSTNSPGIGGKIKQNVDDFIVEEILVDGSKAEVDYRKVTAKAVLGSTSTKGQYLL
jgi:tRNA(Glu) U13 pseudouridine synthase TruD